MPTPQLKEDLTAEYASKATHASLHSADPGDTGADEIAIAREPITWNAGSVDGQIVSDPISITVPAGTDVTHVGIWNDDTAGVFQDKYANAVSFDEETIYTFTLVYNQQ